MAYADAYAQNTIVIDCAESDVEMETYVSAALGAIIGGVAGALVGGGAVAAERPPEKQRA